MQKPYGEKLEREPPFLASLTAWGMQRHESVKAAGKATGFEPGNLRQRTENIYN